MVRWRLLAAADELADWDDRLSAFADHSIYQTCAWGEHRRAMGWTPYRWACHAGNTIISMAQGLVRRYRCGIGVIWIPGGPVGDIGAWGQELQECIRRDTRLNFIYCRLNLSRASDRNDSMRLAAGGWRPPRSPLTSAASLLYDLTQAESDRIRASSKNWRHNLKRSHKGSFTVAPWANPNVAEMRAVYEEMEGLKRLPLQHSDANLRSLYEHLDKHLITYACRDPQGKLLAFRACAVFGDKAWDMLAATSAAGRKTYASYATFWALTQECHRRGIWQYDLSGIDREANRGVYDFKTGTGAAPIEYLGEWEWASPGLFALPANWLIGRRRNGL